VKEHQPSMTAQGAATLRAAHQVLDEPRVFADALALEIVGPEAAGGIEKDPSSLQTPHRRRQRAGIAARSRFAEDELAKAVARGVRQYVLLGAGLDTFAYRNPHPGLYVFEVDHPATQAWKRERLHRSGIALPPSLIFAPVDFERQGLADGLRAVGFDFARPAFFSWLGVVTYLTRTAVMETLRVIATLPKGTSVVFTYSTSPDGLAPELRAAYHEAANRVAELGEPWRTFFDPAALARDLGDIGFGETLDLAPEEINGRYFADRADGLRAGPTGHLMLAMV
jgi:methyltransferase (TIGR00027 family)